MSRISLEDFPLDNKKKYGIVTSHRVNVVQRAGNGDFAVVSPDGVQDLVGSLLRGDDLHQRRELDLRVLAEARVHDVRTDHREFDL